uniref:Annexin n=1 Tax=Ascaris suum TaxID=6253 RepID=F1KZ37_ASCSU
MPFKTQLLSTILNEVSKGIGSRNQDHAASNQTYNPDQGNSNQRMSGSGYYSPQMNNPGAGYPPPGGGYPGQYGFHPGQQGSYPGQGCHGYPPSGYPPQPGAYPPQQPSYPGQPPQPPYPNQQPQHPYPNQQPYYPPSQASSHQPQYPGQAAPYPQQNQGFDQGYSSAGYPDLSQFQNTPSIPNFNYHASTAGMQGTPTIRPYEPFNANADAETLRKAMKGFGCDKSKIIAVLCARCNAQRQQISIAFKSMYGKDLLKDLKSELTGDFEDLILALMEPPARYDAQQLHKAIAGLGTKESVLIEIMCSRSNAEILQIRSFYRQMYGTELEKDLIGDTSGYFKRLLVSMCAAGRDESMHVDPLKANQDARALYRAGEQRLGTDESCFNAILAAQNYAQLRLVFQEYQKVSKHTIEKAIEAEFSGDIKDGLLAIVACVQNKPAYFAKLLYESMVGLGTRDNDLIRLVVTRSEVDLADVRQQFQQLYKKSLESMIKGDCSGAYKDGLIALVKGN